MPKKHRVDYLKRSSATARGLSTAASADKPQRSVNELLANLRNSGPASSTTSNQHQHQQLPTTTPSVPPVIREILQLPETPAPAPRRALRRRFDNAGRRLPAGPPPPRSWTSTSANAATSYNGGVSLNASLLQDVILPGEYLPENGSLLNIILKKIAQNWESHKVYDQYYLYDIPSHLKPALIRYISATHQTGVKLTDLKTLLTPPPDEDGNVYEEAENLGVSHLDIAGSVESTVKLKQLSELLFPPQSDSEDEPSESWDDEDVYSRGIRPALVPNLTHLSLALNPELASKASWKQLLAIAPKLSGITHLSLAYWPTPCLTRQGQTTTIASPQGKNIPYGGTNIYSHSLDHDWSEALLLLKILSKNLYALEYLDLTGCSSWFKALMLQDDQDYVDWVSNWGKISSLRLNNGWHPDDETMPSKQIEYIEACNNATAVEKHIIAMRGGRGRFLTVERDRLDS